MPRNQSYGILEQHADVCLRAGLDMDKVRITYPHNLAELGLLFEQGKKRTFTPIFYGPDLMKWINCHEGKDPLKQYPYPKGELIQLYYWAKEHVCQCDIVPMRAEVLRPEERVCVNFGYAPFVVRANDRAMRSLTGIVKGVADARVRERYGSQSIGEIMGQQIVL